MTTRILGAAGALLLSTVYAAARPPAQLDSPSITGSGNFINGDMTPEVNSQFAILAAAGAHAMRMSVYPYWYVGPDGVTPDPEKEDAQILAAHERGVQTIIIQFEYVGEYAKHTDPPNQLGDASKWKGIGHAFAQRFAPNSAFFTSHGIRDWGVRIFEAMNEADNDKESPIPLTGASSYYSTLEGLADGVHEVDPTLAVVPGGLCTECSSHSHTCNGYALAIAPLLNSGKLDGIDFHTYNDIKYAPIIDTDGQVTFDFSPQAAFDNVKKACGITRDINFYCTEYNFKAGEQGIDENLAAKRLLTCIWANLGVVKSDGHMPATKLALVWNLFNTVEKDQTYGLTASNAKPGEDWAPTARGKTLQMVMKLTGGMTFTHLDPLGRGEFTLEGNGRKIWVWQNYPRFSSIAGTRYTVTGISASAKRLKVYGWDGLRKAIDLHGESSVTIDDLGERETYMFVALP
jgi:hypothetical protein